MITGARSRRYRRRGVAYLPPGIYPVTLLDALFGGCRLVITTNERLLNAGNVREISRNRRHRRTRPTWQP